jgi:ribosomal protein L15E
MGILFSLFPGCGVMELRPKGIRKDSSLGFKVYSRLLFLRHRIPKGGPKNRKNDEQKRPLRQQIRGLLAINIVAFWWEW